MRGMNALAALALLTLAWNTAPAAAQEPQTDPNIAHVSDETLRESADLLRRGGLDQSYVTTIENWLAANDKLSDANLVQASSLIGEMIGNRVVSAGAMLRLCTYLDRCTQRMAAGLNMTVDEFVAAAASETLEAKTSIRAMLAVANVAYGKPCSAVGCNTTPG